MKDSKFLRTKFSNMKNSTRKKFAEEKRKWSTDDRLIQNLLKCWEKQWKDMTHSVMMMIMNKIIERTSMWYPQTEEIILESYIKWMDYVYFYSVVWIPEYLITAQLKVCKNWKTSFKKKMLTWALSKVRLMILQKENL